MAKTTQTLDPRNIKDVLKSTAKKLEGRVWGSKDQPLNEGDYMVGRLVAIDEGVGDHESTMLRFEDPFGNEVATWQRGTLKTKINHGLMGKYLMIEYVGTQPATKKGFDDMHVYDVYKLTEAQFSEFARTFSADELPF